MKIPNETQELLLQNARLAIEYHLQAQEFKYQIPPLAILNEKHGVFLTIFVDEKLRGSLGYVDSQDCLMGSVIDLAKAVSQGNTKYPKLEKFELPYLTIQISILSALKQIYTKQEIEIGKHGLYVNHPEGQGLLLPQVAIERDFDRVIFLNEVCHQAGLPSFTWEDDECKVYIFDTVSFSDKKTH